MEEKYDSDSVATAAVCIAENIYPSLNANEQAFFIAGFQECIKWISSNTIKQPQIDVSKEPKTCKWNGNLDSCGNETCWDLVECQKNPVSKQEPKSAHEVFNEINNRRVIKWEGLSDGGKWTRAIEAMEEYKSQ